MTRAMDPEVADAIWAAIGPILPIPVDENPLGCHDPRVPDRLCFGTATRCWLIDAWQARSAHTCQGIMAAGGHDRCDAGGLRDLWPTMTVQSA